MIDFGRLIGSLDHSLDDLGKFRAALGLLCSTVRRYNRISEEPERLKELTGFDKPFPILRLPREIRDEIYTYCLCATTSVVTIPQRPFNVTTDNPIKPPTPGLLRVNKQIYHEAIGILYSKNIFKFERAGQLFAFEEQISLESRKWVREICIWIRFPEKHEVVLNPKCLLQSEYGSERSHWIAALKACSLEKIVHLGIEAKADSFFCDPCMVLLPMPKRLQESIEEFIGRGTTPFADGIPGGGKG